MKIALVLILSLISGIMFAGGSSGGTPPSVQDFDTLALIDQLPEAYADPNEFRRANARLSVAGTETTPMTIEGEAIQVRKLRDSVVDEKVLKQILPAK